MGEEDGWLAETRVIMVRHADVHNPGSVVYARLPRFRLSATGREQAEALARRSAEPKSPPSTPAPRARQTALTLRDALGCDRIRVSAWIDEVETSYAGRANMAFTAKNNFYDTPAGPDDETIPMIARRMRRFLDLVTQRHIGSTVVAVSHADPIMILRAQVLGLPLATKSLQGKYYPAKCSLMEFLVGEPGHPITVEYRELVRDKTKPKKKKAGKSKA